MPVVRTLRLAALAAATAAFAAGCSSGDAEEQAPFELTVVTFNTGTTEGLGHDGQPDDGYGSEQATFSDLHYGDGLAWVRAVDDARQFFLDNPVDIVAFQEIFYSPECENVPAEARPGFVCETWRDGDPSVASVVLGDDFQVACNIGKPDKCLAVRRSVGTFAGCDADLCTDALAGARVDDCGSGSRIGRGVIELTAGGSLTVVGVHGSSGLTQDDQDCREKQFVQVFEDLGTGDGRPAADGERNIVLGDLNTDPGRTVDFDESAAKWNEHVGEGKRFRFISDVGTDVEPTYAGLFNIDHVVADGFSGSCWVAGVGERPPVTEMVYFDHKPVVCSVRER